MTIKLKPDVSLDELVRLVGAMLSLRDAQINLRTARANPAYRNAIPIHEDCVCRALDGLWEAQQHAEV